MTLDFWAPAIDKGASGADLGPTKEGIAGHIIKRRFADPYSALPQTNVIDIRSHRVSWRIQPRNSRMAGHRRRKDSPQRIGEPDGHPPPY